MPSHPRVVVDVSGIPRDAERWLGAASAAAGNLPPQQADLSRPRDCRSPHWVIFRTRPSRAQLVRPVFEVRRALRRHDSRYAELGQGCARLPSRTVEIDPAVSFRGSNSFNHAIEGLRPWSTFTVRASKARRERSTSSPLPAEPRVRLDPHLAKYASIRMPHDVRAACRAQADDAQKMSQYDGKLPGRPDAYGSGATPKGCAFMNSQPAAYRLLGA